MDRSCLQLGAWREEAGGWGWGPREKGPKGEETQVDTVQTQVHSQNTWAEFRPELRGLASCLVSTCHMLHVLTALFPAVSHMASPIRLITLLGHHGCARGSGTWLG